MSPKRHACREKALFIYRFLGHFSRRARCRRRSVVRNLSSIILPPHPSFVLSRVNTRRCRSFVDAFDTALTGPAGMICENCRRSQERWRSVIPWRSCADDSSWSEQQQQRQQDPRRFLDECARRGFSQFRCSYEIGRFNYSAYQVAGAACRTCGFNEHLRATSGFNSDGGRYFFSPYTLSTNN